MYPTAGAPVSFEARNRKTKRPDNTYPTAGAQCPSRPEIARQKDQTIHTRRLEPLSAKDYISHLGQQDSHGFPPYPMDPPGFPIVSDAQIQSWRLNRHASRSRPRHLLPRPPQQPPPRRLPENLQLSRSIVCSEADCARGGELIAEELEFVFIRGLWQLRFFCNRCGSCTKETCPSTSESEESESQDQ